MYMIDFFGGAPCESQAPQRQIEGTRNGSCKSHAVVSVAEPRRARPFLGHFVCTVVRPSAHRTVETVLVKLQARDGVKLGRLRDSFKASRCADCAAKVIGKTKQGWMTIADQHGVEGLLV